MKLYEIENMFLAILLCSTNLFFVTGTLLLIFNKKRIELATKILKITLILYFLTISLWVYIIEIRTYAY